VWPTAIVLQSNLYLYSSNLLENDQGDRCLICFVCLVYQTRSLKIFYLLAVSINPKWIQKANFKLIKLNRKNIYINIHRYKIHSYACFYMSCSHYGVEYSMGILGPSDPVIFPINPRVPIWNRMQMNVMLTYFMSSPSIPRWLIPVMKL